MAGAGRVKGCASRDRFRLKGFARRDHYGEDRGDDLRLCSSVAVGFGSLYWDEFKFTKEIR